MNIIHKESFVELQVFSGVQIELKHPVYIDNPEHLTVVMNQIKLSSRLINGSNSYNKQLFKKDRPFFPFSICEVTFVKEKKIDILKSIYE